MKTQTTNFAFSVPVCDTCSEILDKSDGRVKIGRIVISIFTAAALLYVSASSGSLFCGWVLAVLTYVALHFAYINRPISSQTLGGYTGKYFWFSNREFFKQFAQLNTQLVAPEHYSQFSSGDSSSVFVTGAQTRFQWTRSNIILMLVLFLSLLCIGAVVAAPFLLS